MYSVVLIMALSSGAEVPADGCYGGGCWGGGCNGGGCHGGLFHHRQRCHGGGLFAGHRCHGGCHGGGGLFHHRQRCHGGCNGGSACHGGYVGCMGAAPVVSGCWSSGAMVAPPAAGPAAMPGAPKGPEKVPPPKSSTPEKEAALPAPATIIVSLPAQAKLLIDDAGTASSSALRAFVSPSLEPGKDFYYTLKGELQRDGRTYTTSQRVIVRAGQQSRVQLDFPAASIVQR